MSGSLQRWFAAFASALALGGQLAARADDLQDAKRWVAEGDAAEGAHDYSTAITKYQLALRVKRTPQIYLRLGLAQEENGNLAEAMRSYDAAAPLAAGNDQALSLVSKQIEQLRPRIGYVAVAVASPPASARVTVNDTPVTDFGAETAVNPGEVTVRASAPGRADSSKHVHVGAGEHAHVDVAFGAPVAQTEAPKPVPVTPPPSSAHPSVAGIVLISVGVVGIAVGAGVLGQGLKYGHDLGVACPVMNGRNTCVMGTMVDGTPAEQLPNKINTFEGAGGATLGVGAAAGIIGGVLLGLSLRSHDSTNAQIVPLVGPTVAGAVYSQSF